MYEAVERNVRGTWILFVSFILLVAALGYVFGTLTNFGYPGAILATLLATAVAWASYYFSDQIILSISGAREVSRDDHPYLHNAVEGLAIAAGVPPPRVYLIDDSAPNAFATGRDPQHAAIVVTTGLLEKLDRLELEGVLAHEMSHIQNYDIRLATVATILVGTVALLSDWFLRGLRWGGGRGGRDEDGGGRGGSLVLIVVGVLLALLAPLIAQLMRLAISRQREFLADANGAMLTRYPEGLARALEKIGADRDPLRVANKATAHMYIVNPLHASGGRDNSLFDTHPPLAERVHRLREMAGAPPWEDKAATGRKD
jgi:heat shock protein HtpX